MLKGLVALALTLITFLPPVAGTPLHSWLTRPLTSSLESSRLNQPQSHHWVAQPHQSGNQPLSLGALSIYALDLDSAKILYNHDANTPRPIASITKLVTVMVILHQHSIDETVTIPTLPAYHPEDAQLAIVAGQKFRLGDLLSAALIPSANDAADALAIYDAGSIEAFTAKMNQTITDWDIPDAHFTSANGLNEQDNFASAESLAKLAKIALASPIFRQTVATPSARITDLAGKPYTLTSTNQLLSDSRFSGLKTGFTPAAGQSLVGLASIKGHRVITVVLNSPDRFAETTGLANWLEANWTWQ